MYDFLIVGSGIAGLFTALLAQKHGRVLLLSKSRMDDTNTNHAQGGIAAPVGTDDSPERHWRDTLEAGAGLNDPLATWALVREARARIDDLVALGVPFDREDGRLALAREGAHSAARVLHAGGDGTGASIQSTLGRLARESANVDVRQYHEVTSLLLLGNAARGVIAVTGGEQRQFGARAVILATGGAGRLYQHTTNPPVATGSGVALAYQAGASVADLEFCQFHPTAFALPGAPRFLISEAARGEGAILRDVEGRRFMFDYDARGELAPRHVVANAMRYEMSRLNTPYVYLDLTHLRPDVVLRRFPCIAAFCRNYALDITRQPIPVAPAAHYMMGGVRTDLWGRTDITGLFACGEVACTGVHGANRLASNSLLEGLVFASRIVRYLVDPRSACTDDLAAAELGDERVPLEDRRWGPADPGESDMWEERRPAVALPTAQDVQGLMWRNAGMERSRQSLREAGTRLTAWSGALERSAIATNELRDMVIVARLIVGAATAREESRGAHYRADFPNTDPAWRRRLVYRRKDASRTPAFVGARRS